MSGVGIAREDVQLLTSAYAEGQDTADSRYVIHYDLDHFLEYPVVLIYGSPVVDLKGVTSIEQRLGGRLFTDSPAELFNEKTQSNQNNGTQNPIYHKAPHAYL
jgi:hypothetical protein